MKPPNICIFASRESKYILCRTISSVANNVSDYSVLDVLINGNERLLKEIGEDLQRGFWHGCKRLRLWYVPLADKSNAWNEYIHRISDPESHAIFMDGYIQLTPDAIENLKRTFLEFPEAIGTCGIPSVGFTARSLMLNARTVGAFYGSLCALSSSAIREMRIRSIRIPVGIYRGDIFMASILSFKLDNAKNKWDPHRWIPATFNATWKRDRRNYLRACELIAFKNRWIRQVRGRLESRAIRYQLMERRALPEQVPQDAKILIESRVQSCPDELRSYTYRLPHYRNALKYFQRLRESSRNDSRAILVADRVT